MPIILNIHFTEIHLPLETTTTTTTPRYVATKPHKPAIKTAKPKSGKARKKEPDSKKEEKDSEVPFIPESKSPTPISVLATTTQTPSVILQQRNGAMVLSNLYTYIFIGCISIHLIEYSDFRQ